MDICIFRAYTENIYVSGHIEIAIHTHTHACTSTLELETKHGIGLSFQEKAKGFCKNILFQSKEFDLFASVRDKCKTGILLKNSY